MSRRPRHAGSMTDIKNVTVLGTGVLGSQIAYQTAYTGFQVSVYDINDEVIAQAKKRFEQLAPSHKREWVRSIEDAKKPETRLRRIEKAMTSLREDA